MSETDGVTHVWSEVLYFSECPWCGGLQQWGEMRPEPGSEQECQVCERQFKLEVKP